MTNEQLQSIIASKVFPHGKSAKVELVETPISQVLLTPRYVYKIKKSVRLNFLDFTTLTLRKKYCEEEIRLNRRFSPQMYLNIYPIYSDGKDVSFKKIGKIIDYAVQMKRMDTKKEMLRLVEQGRVKTTQINALAKIIADFHTREKSLQLNYQPAFIAKEYSDISSVLSKVKKNLPKEISTQVKQCIKESFLFIHKNSDFILQRVKSGCFKDCHGDLHMRNIFLYSKPILFDCIEFEKEFRQIDTLNDLAFLAMDLEASKKEVWAKILLQEYQKHTHKTWDEPTTLLFIYFKSFRACVRAKVAMLSLNDHTNDPHLKKEVIKYVNLMTSYMHLLR
jgi:aminoglycoside phosphotransferase family enzyme